MEPPPMCTLLGRPPVKRTRTKECERRSKVGAPKQKVQQQTQDNGNNNSNLPPSPPHKLSKRGTALRCSVCHKESHNRATCKNQPKTSTGITSNKGPRISEAPQTQESQSTPWRPRGERAFYKLRSKTGMGVRVDLDTGRTVYDPGMTSQVVIDEGSTKQYMSEQANIETRFSILNERTMRMTRSMSVSNNSGSRQIKVQSESASGPTPSDLPFTPPSLMWRG